MFCPQCGAENSLDQKYCRRCGLQLAASRISLQGGVGPALARHRQGEVMFASGGGTLVIFVLAALANIFLNAGAWNYAVLINLFLGLVIAVPLMAAGFVHMRRAGRTLHPKGEPDQLAGDQSDGARLFTSSAYSTDPLLPPMRTPDSVTEETTVNLRVPKHGNG